MYDYFLSYYYTTTKISLQFVTPMDIYMEIDQKRKPSHEPFNYQKKSHGPFFFLLSMHAHPLTRNPPNQ